MNSKNFFPHLHIVDQGAMHPYYSDVNMYRESYNDIYALMCEGCFRLHYFEVNYSSFIKQVSDTNYLFDLTSSLEVSFRCMCGHEVKNDGNFMDPNIAPIIAELNRKGYWTRYCCEGHPELCGDYIYSRGYIMFINGKIMSEVIHQYPLPKKWKVDESVKDDPANYYKDGLIINYTGKNLDPPEVKLSPLLDWVDFLPTRDSDDIIRDRHRWMKERESSV